MSKKEKQINLIPQQGECVIAKFLKKEVRKTFHNNDGGFLLLTLLMQ